MKFLLTIPNIYYWVKLWNNLENRSTLFWQSYGQEYGVLFLTHGVDPSGTRQSIFYIYWSLTTWLNFYTSGVNKYHMRVVNSVREIFLLSCNLLFWHFIILNKMMSYFFEGQLLRLVIMLLSVGFECSALPVFIRGRPRGGMLGSPLPPNDHASTRDLTLPPDMWMTQRLDHFHASDTRTWKQVTVLHKVHTSTSIPEVNNLGSI